MNQETPKVAVVPSLNLLICVAVESGGLHFDDALASVNTMLAEPMNLPAFRTRVGRSDGLLELKREGRKKVLTLTNKGRNLLASYRVILGQSNRPTVTE